MLAVGTWACSQLAIEHCRRALIDGETALDAVTKGISTIEADHASGPYIVGCGGFPNSAGILQCDAAVMTGADCQFGAVVAMEGVSTPIQVARRVLQKAPPCMLAGAGASAFARREGFRIEDNSTLLGKSALDAWEEWKARGSSTAPVCHDTLGVIARGPSGELTAGVSTSGCPYKMPGRVGDSPLPGGGLYADNQQGAAVCTGDGDAMLRFCPAHRAVTLMAHGATPTGACRTVVSDLATRLATERFEMAIVAVDIKGAYGAAGTVETWTDPVTANVFPGFPYCVWTEGSEPTLKVEHALKI